MRKYAAMYNDFSIVDGTHNTTMYDLKLIPCTNVDCFGKNVFSGFIFDETENSESVAHGLRLFGLDQEGATLMTDGGTAFPATAAELGMIHILCTQHFQQDVFSSCGGMGDSSHSFKKDALSLIYKAYPTEEQFMDAVMLALMTYSSHGSAIKTVKKIVEFKHKVCHTFTGWCSFQNS